MANDCLVTRLKGVVDNDSLLKLGEMRIKCSTAACGGTTTEGMRTLILSGGGLITAGGRTFKAKKSGDASYSEVAEWDASNRDIEHNYIFPDGEYDISIGDKYNIIGFGTNNNISYSSFFSFKLEDLVYSKDLALMFGLDKYCITGELKYVKVDNIRGISLSDYLSPQGNNSFMNIDMLSDSLKLLQLKLYRLPSYLGTKSYGSINNLKSPVLNSLMINWTNITGDINTMIQNMIAAGRTDGTIYTQGNNLITVNGTPFNEFRNSLPGSNDGAGINFTIDLTAPNNWTAAKTI